MADAKTTALSSLATPSDDDLLYIVDDPGGSPVGKKVTLAALRAALLNIQQASASGDATLSSNTTFVDVPGCSLSLPAGTWLVIGQFQFYKAATTSVLWNGQLCDSSAASIYAEGAMVTPSLNPQGDMLTILAKVVLGSTTTVKMRAQVYSGGASTTKVLQIAFGVSGSQILAIRVA